MVWFQDTQWKTNSSLAFKFRSPEITKRGIQNAIGANARVTLDGRSRVEVLCDCCAEGIFSQIVMNSFSSVFKRRASTLTIATLCAIGVLCAIGLRAYSAHKDKVAARYAKRVPVGVVRLSIPGVVNAGRVSEFLYRGAQPRGNGYEELKKLGISIVVDLRNSKPVKSDDGQTREQVKVEAAGMRYVEIPTSAFFGPTQGQVASFLQLLRDNEKQKVFVHCYFGDDRTGVMVATYRIAMDHWTSDEAYNEMRAFHFHKHLILMGHFVKLFPAEFALSPVFATLRQETGAALRGDVTTAAALAWVSFCGAFTAI